MKNIRLVQMDLAEEVGIGESMVVCQLHYWSSKPKIGMVVDGVKYIKNSYEQWIAEENFPCFSLSTIKRIFKKLINMGIVLVNKFKKSSWDHTNYFALNYSHPSLTPLIVSDRNEYKGQLDTPDSVNLTRSLNTYSTPEKTTEKTYREPPVSFLSKPSTSPRPTETREKKGKDTRGKDTRGKYKLEYKKASSWLEKKEKSFRAEVLEYAEYHCSKPGVYYPQALKQKIIAEIWKKFTGQPHHTDFDYVDKEKLLNVSASHIECRKKKTSSLDDEMMQLYQTGELYEQAIG